VALSVRNCEDGNDAMEDTRKDYGEERAANLTLIGLLGLFAFVVFFIFISMTTEMVTRSDLPPTATAYNAAAAPAR
jgi:divalent metal cation (Fe/Co/Zn/Cd) transporter